MSFGFTAAGTVDQVRAQLDTFTSNDSLGQAVKALLETELLGDTAPTSGMAERELGFLVEASGHRDPHNASLTISVRPLWLPATTVKDVAVPKVEG
jgi:hypothetical protein